MTEIELKLALTQDPGARLVHTLARTPLLAGGRPRRQLLHNVYFDTPDHQVLRHGMVLRLRRVGTGARLRWLQTLKTGDRGDSALSRRGEWESPVAGPALSAALLKTTPWAEMDPDGLVYAQLQPCFSTDFTRTRWTLPWPDGSVVEVALDLGQVVAGTQTKPIREFELELKAGQASSLFDVALQLAQVVAVIPSSASKSERGYGLAGAAPAAVPTGPGTPPTLDSLAQAALQAAFRQFTGHLLALRASDDPEQVHQARVAWRRLRSARRLFGSKLRSPFPAVQDTLQPLLGSLGAVRDMDEARTESLPRVANAYIAGDPQRNRQWQQMLGRLRRASASLRKNLLQTLDDPATGQALIRVTQWLDALVPQDTPDSDGPAAAAGPLRAWARRKIRAQRRKLRAAGASTDDIVRLHQVRILAKRLRYGIDALRPVLPPRRAQRWQAMATRLQSGIGMQRDAMLAARLVAGLERSTPIAEFLRGHLAGATETQGKP